MYIASLRQSNESSLLNKGYYLGLDLDLLVDNLDLDSRSTVPLQVRIPEQDLHVPI